jgi:hypothetical protein
MNLIPQLYRTDMRTDNFVPASTQERKTHVDVLVPFLYLRTQSLALHEIYACISYKPRLRRPPFLDEVLACSIMRYLRF